MTSSKATLMALYETFSSFAQISTRYASLQSRQAGIELDWEVKREISRLWVWGNSGTGGLTRESARSHAVGSGLLQPKEPPSPC